MTTLEKILFRKAGIESKFAELFPGESLASDWPEADKRLTSFKGSFPTPAGETAEAPAVAVSRDEHGRFQLGDIQDEQARRRVQETLSALFDVSAANRDRNASVVYTHEKE